LTNSVVDAFVVTSKADVNINKLLRPISVIIYPHPKLEPSATPV